MHPGVLSVPDHHNPVSTSTIQLEPVVQWTLWSWYCMKWNNSFPATELQIDVENYEPRPSWGHKHGTTNVPVCSQGRMRSSPRDRENKRNRLNQRAFVVDIMHVCMYESVHVHLCSHGVWSQTPHQSQSDTRQDRTYCRKEMSTEVLKYILHIHTRLFLCTHKCMNPNISQSVPELRFGKVISLLQTGDQICREKKTTVIYSVLLDLKNELPDFINYLQHKQFTSVLK